MRQNVCYITCIYSRLNFNQYTVSEYSFGIGFRFYYWDSYKAIDHQSQMRQHKSNINDHRGYLEHELYIAAKYSSLKDEILNNSILSLPPYHLKISMTKTKQYLITYKARSIKFSGFASKNYKLYYGILKNSPLKFSHLLSIILYTDWTDLSREFSKSFRKLKKYESLMTVKKRNKEYANWSKNLRELIESYGNDGNRRNKETGPFYCGMSYPMVMPQFHIRLSAPTSTTKQYSVASRFSGSDGIIITLNNDTRMSRYLTFWNCSWMSNYGAEDERVFK